jgi:hypothetical protein
MLIDVVAKNRDRYINYNNNKDELNKITENIRIQPWFLTMPATTQRALLKATSRLEVIKNTDDMLTLRMGLAYLTARTDGGVAVRWTTVPQDMEIVAPGYYSVAGIIGKIKEADEDVQPDIPALRRIFSAVLGLHLSDAQILGFTREILLFFDVHLEISL